MSIGEVEEGVGAVLVLERADRVSVNQHDKGAAEQVFGDGGIAVADGAIGSSNAEADLFLELAKEEIVNG